eukprot:3154367-Prymnesium_polylepis.1
MRCHLDIGHTIAACPRSDSGARALRLSCLTHVGMKLLRPHPGLRACCGLCLSVLQWLIFF